MNKTSAILQSLGFGYGQTECKFPNNAKPFSLYAIFRNSKPKSPDFLKNQLYQMNIFKYLLYVHIFSGSISLILGLIVMTTKKGTKNHKLIGIIYYYSMLIAAVVSFPMSYLHSDYFLFIVGVFTTYMLLTGKRYLAKKQTSDIKIIDWILTITMLIFGIAFIAFGIHKIINNNSFGTVLLVFGAISCLFVWRDKRNFEGLSKYKNFGLVTHIQRMVASYIATVTAFLVVNNKILPDVVAWLLPTALLVPLLVKWVVKYKIKNLVQK